MIGEVRAGLVPGLVGLAPTTNAVYYRDLNAAAEEADASRTAKSLLFTINFLGVARDIRAGRLDSLGASLVDAGERLASGGADFLVLTSNTGHIVADEVRRRAGIPLLDVREVVASELRGRGVTRCGLLSTTATRDYGLYELVLDPMNVEVLHPSAQTGAAVDAVIFKELVAGIDDGDAGRVLRSAADELRLKGAEAVVLACTDMALVSLDVGGCDVIDSTRLHARTAGIIAAGGRPLDYESWLR
jgi:aspartate racemase